MSYSTNSGKSKEIDLYCMKSNYTEIADDIQLNSTRMKLTLLSILRLPKTGKAIAGCLQLMLGECDYL